MKTLEEAKNIHATINSDFDPLVICEYIGVKPPDYPNFFIRRMRKAHEDSDVPFIIHDGNPHMIECTFKGHLFLAIRLSIESPNWSLLLSVHDEQYCRIGFYADRAEVISKITDELDRRLL